MGRNTLGAKVYRRIFSGWGIVIVLLAVIFTGQLDAQMLTAGSRQSTFAVASSLPGKPVLLASLRPAPGLVWQRVKSSGQPLDGPVLYQIIFRSSATPGHIPRIANNFTLTNSLISDNGTQVAIGGFSVNGNTGIITFANGQTFPGTGGVNSVASGNNFITIGGTATNPTVALDTTATDARYLQLGGGTMSGTITFANGQVFPGTGTVTNVATGAGLSGGPITGTGTISIANSGVTNAMLANPSVTINTLNGSGLAGGGPLALGGTLALSIPNSGVTNTMLANSALTVNAGSGLTGGGSVALGGNTSLSLDTTFTNAHYLQLGGGTLTGALNGTTASFSGALSALSFTGDGSALTNVTANNALALGGNAASSYKTTAQNDLRYLQFGGGTLTGALNGTTASFSGALGALSFTGDGSALTNVTANNALALGGNAASSYKTTSQNDLRYLQFSGGTLTGALNGTTANFSGALNALSFTGDGSALTNVTATTANNALALGGNLAASYKTTAQNDLRYLQFSGGTLTGGLVLGAAGTANSGAGANSNPQDWVASVFNSNTGTAQNQFFRWQTEPAGNNSASPSGSFNLLFSGTSNNFTPTETGFSIASNGRITFAPGQSFPAAGLPAAGGDLSGTLPNATVVGLQGHPVSNNAPNNGQVLQFNGAAWAPATVSGSGTVSSVGSGLGLTGGPITNSGTLAIDTAVVPQLGAGNTFSASNLFAGGVQHPPVGSATPGGGFNSSALDLSASSFNSGAGAAVNQRFRWLAEPINNNSNNASGTLNLLFSAGNNPAAETGLSIANNGQITFAPGQTFPGSVNSVGAGDSSITIGGTASAPTVAVANGGVTNVKLANPSLTVTAGAGLSGGGSVALGGNTTLGIANAGVTNAMLQNSSVTVTPGPGLTGGGSVALGGSTTLSIANAGITNGMLQNSSVTVNTGAGLSGGGSVALGGTLNLSNAGVLSVVASGPLASSGGANPSISLTGAVPIANGGTGITTAPASAGQYLRSSGAGTWAVGGIQAGDVPSLSGTYVDLASNQSIAGNKSFTQTATATVGNGVTSALVGNASDPNAIAILGQATDTTVTGVAVGVQGATSSPGGTGVSGVATDTSDAGFTIGVMGKIAGPNGYAVNGVATDTTGGTGGVGSTIGVRGRSASPNGFGMLGQATSTAANAAGIGVNGRSDSPNGIGLRGFASDTTGTGLAIGVLGFTSKVSNPAALFNNNDANCTGASCQILWGQAKGNNVFKVLGNGAVQAAAYQDLNGNPINAGTVTSVGTGAGLTGGPVTSSGTISIANAGVTNAMLAANSVTNANIADGSLNPAKITGTAATLGANSFNGNQGITGNLTVSGSVTGGTLAGNGSGLTNLNASNLSSGTVPVSVLAGAYNIDINGNAATATNAAQLGGIAATNYARQDIPNNFTGIQNLGSNATIAVARFNEATTGTTLNRLAKLDSGGAAIISSPGDVQGVIGVVMTGSGTSGQAQIAISGVAFCNFDTGSQHGGDYVTISATTAGECHDAGAVFPMGTQVIGRVGFTGSSPSNSVYLYGPEHLSTNITAADNTINVTGTPFVPALSVNGANVSGVNAAQLGGLGSGAYAQLAANNSFTGTSNSFTNSSILPTVTLRNNSTGSILVGSNGGTVFNFDKNGNEDLTVNGGNVYLGNAGCISPFTGIGFGNSGMTGCANFSLLGNGADTVINRPTGGSIFFRENNTTQMSIAPGGAVNIANGVTVGTSVNNNGSGIKHARMVFGSVGANGGNGSRLFWPTPFADANYTVTTSVEDTDGSSFAPLTVILSNRAANFVDVSVRNADSVNHSCVVHLIAMHD